MIRDDPARADADGQRALGELAARGGELAVPIGADPGPGGLGGLLVIGPKRSGDPYFDEDVALLGALAAEAAVALANARLHRDVVRAREQIETILQTMPSAVVAVNRLGQVEWFKTHFQLLPEGCTCAAQEEQREFASVGTREIDRIDALLERLMGMREVPRATFTPVDLGEVVRESLRLLQASLSQASVTVVPDLEGGCRVRGDREQLQQLCLNLVVNAREAVSDRGEIHVRCGERRGRSRRTVFLEVADTGPGISESVRETVFEPFVTTKRHGTGLGLALCRAIVDVHRGTIRAENRDPGPGAVFTVEFPAAGLG